MGLLFVNGICYSDSSETNGVIPITWDQYSNLTEEQKMNDTPYYITDAPSGYALASKTRTITTPTSLATFEASEMPMPSLKVSVEAQQDLHGYDKPWVGGAGKNKLPNAIPKTETINGITYKLDEYGVFTITGTSTGTSTCTFALAESFVIPSGEPKPKIVFNNTIATNSVFFHFYNNTTQIEVWSLSPVNRVSEYTTMQGMTCTAFKISVGIAGITLNMTISPMIVENSVTDYSFAPYSNICPISGWSEVVVSDVGKNMIDDNLSDLEQGTIDGSYGSNSSSNSRVRSLAVDFDYDNIVNANYRLTIPNGYQIAFRPYKEDGSYVFIDSTVIGFISSLPRTWLGKGIKKMRFVFAKTDYSDITPADIANIGYQLEKGSTATTYEPYINQTTTISLPQTVYGAEVDVVNGTSGNKLTHQFETISGGITTTDSSGNLFVVKDLSVPRINDYNTVTPYIISNYLTPYSVNDLRANAVFGFTQYGKRLYVRLGDEITTVEDANAYLASNNLQIKYELETPTTFTTQPTPIKSLEGTNNLSVDCGDVIEGEYLAPLGTDIAMNNQLYGAGEAVLSEYSNKAETVLQKQLHHIGSSVEEHKILFSSKETTSTDQNKGDAYDCVSKDDGFSYYTSDNEHGLVLTTLGKNMVEGDYLTFASLTNKELRMFSRPNLSSGTQPDIMTVKPDDIVISKDGWDGNVANSSLKTTLAKARKGVSDYTLTSYGSSTNCDWSDSFVHKNNGVVYLNAFVEVTSNLSAGDTIFTFNNNTPICPYNIGDAGFPVIVEDENDNLTLNYISCLDNNNFEIKKPVSAGNYINVSFVYLNNKGE